jgi:hypothetical protein
MRLEEAIERRSALACSSKNVARDIEKSLANFTAFSFGEKKRFLGEVIHKIKVDSKDEVHLFLKPPQGLALGTQSGRRSNFEEDRFCDKLLAWR